MSDSDDPGLIGYLCETVANLRTKVAHGQEQTEAQDVLILNLRKRIDRLDSDLNTARQAIREHRFRLERLEKAIFTSTPAAQLRTEEEIHRDRGQ